MVWSGPDAPAAISTRHSAWRLAPWVGDAKVVIVAFGVLVRRASSRRITVFTVSS
jgi:hypothetical protein